MHPTWLVHAQQDVSRFLGGALSRRINSAEKMTEQAKDAVMKTTESTPESQLKYLTETLATVEQTLTEVKQASRDEYHDNLKGVADELHPFALNDNKSNDANRFRWH